MGDAMGGMIKITEAQWERLHQRLRQDYEHEPSVVLIRAKMRSVLGFTPRRHTQYRDTRVMTGEFGLPEYGSQRVCICLDFYDDSLRTWFLLRYGEYVNG